MGCYKVYGPVQYNQNATVTLCQLVIKGLERKKAIMWDTQRMWCASMVGSAEVVRVFVAGELQIASDGQVYTKSTTSEKQEIQDGVEVHKRITVKTTTVRRTVVCTHNLIASFCVYSCVIFFNGLIFGLRV